MGKIKYKPLRKVVNKSDKNGNPTQVFVVLNRRPTETLRDFKHRVKMTAYGDVLIKEENLRPLIRKKSKHRWEK
jgi:hypothetical protein